MPREAPDQKLIAQIFDNQPDSVVLFSPVFETQHDARLADFEVLYCNDAAARILGVDRSEVYGTRLLHTSLMDDSSLKIIFDQCMEVWKTGKTIQYSYHSPGLDRYFNVQRSKVEACVLSVTRDRTKEVKAGHEKEQQTEFLNRLIDSSPYGIVLYQAIRDDAGIIKDFRARLLNQKSVELTGLTNEDLVSRTMKELIRERQNIGFFNEAVAVVETGKPGVLEYYSPFLHRWLSYSMIKFEDGVLLNYFDISQRKKLEEETKQQAFKFDQILNASLNAIFTCEAVRDDAGSILDFRFVQINEMYSQLIGKTEEDVIGKTMIELFPAVKITGTFNNYCEVIETGQPIRFEAQYRGEGLDAWFDISSVKVGDNGIVVTFADITERKKTELEREQQNELIQTMLNAAFHGKALLEPLRNETAEIIDFTVIAANNATEAQIGIKPEAAIGQRLSTLLPGYNENGAFDMYTAVLASGKAERAEHFYHDERLEAWFDVYVAPVKNGIVVSFANITERKKELQRIEQQKNLLDAILAHSPSGISVTEIIRDERGKVVDGRTLLANEAAIQFVGIPKDLYLTRTAKELDPAILESPVYQMTVNALETGEPFHVQYFLGPTRRWLELSGAKMDDEHLINVFTDVTRSKEVQLQVESFAEKLRTVIDTSQAGFFLGKPVMDDSNEIIDFRFTMVNQVLASFVGKEPDELIGELGSDWFIQYKNNGLFERFRDTYLSGTTQQFDVHYQGETIEVWANVMTTKLGEEVLGSFTDFTPMKQLQLKLEKSVEELRRSNTNLEEFAYAASHDLQEPLRKISFFSEQLRRDLNPQLTAENARKFDRMQNAANRMSVLINDLLNYSKVSVKPDVYEKIDLLDVVEHVLQDLEATIIDTGAVINVGRLPQIKGDKRQLAQVFQNLVSNAIKYRQPDVAPRVTIESRVVNESDRSLSNFTDVRKGMYNLVEISDNGIGFEQKYSEKIFQVFQRLHGRAEYEGTGVGLAIVQKVIKNHQGYIFAESEPGKGAKFSILLPV